jgi:hypothetical protein
MQTARYSTFATPSPSPGTTSVGASGNFKGELQETLSKLFKNPNIVYTTQTVGKLFVSTLTYQICDRPVQTFTGTAMPTKKAAEQRAAQAALQAHAW